MSERRLMPVQIEVIKEVLVDRVLGEVLERYPGSPSPPVRRALEAPLAFEVCDGGTLELRLRRIGYLTRIVEPELFDPARQPAEVLIEQLRARLAAGETWSEATVGLCSALAAEEPLPKPAPDDPDAVTWQVPGPGGHVRHYVVAAAIAEALSAERSWEEPGPPGAMPARLAEGVQDAGELKRAWTYGFLVRCCEEGVPPPRPDGGEHSQGQRPE